MHMQTIKDAFWFVKESKKFTGHGYLHMLFKEQLIRRTIYFCKQIKVDEKAYEQYGEAYYAMQDRTIEM